MVRSIVAGMPTVSTPETERPSSGASLPPSFDPAIYRREAGDPVLATASDEAARQHYASIGRHSGRVAGLVRNRGVFCGLVPRDGVILEIGPFFSPAFRAPRFDVRYLDWLPTEALRAKARETPGGRPESVPDIDYVWRGQPYADLIDHRFHAVFSSHAIEHQPCLVRHLGDVASVLDPGGRYFLIAPDKRYCFDACFPETTIADVLDAYLGDRRDNSARTVMRGWLLASHNDPKRHWAADRPVDTLRQPVTVEYARRVRDAVARWRARDSYIDAHAWQFTPDNFAHLIDLLAASGLIDFTLERVYPTLRDQFEFYAILRRNEQSSDGAGDHPAGMRR